MPRGRPFKPGNDGRPRGARNRITAAFRQSLLDSFQAIGGTTELTRWAKAPKNRALFYQLCARLIPTEVVHGGAVTLPTVTKIIHQAAASSERTGHGA